MCGKLAELGVRIIDADKLGHGIYDKANAAVFAAVKDAFSDVEGIVSAESGQIDRRVLGGVVFGDKERMAQLTGIVWPAMHEKLDLEIQRVVSEIRESKSQPFERPTVCVEAAVLVEAKWYEDVDQVWVVEIPIEVTRVRLMARNSLSEDEANKRIASQMSVEDRRGFANVVITNIDKEEAFSQVEQAVSLLKRASTAAL